MYRIGRPSLGFLYEEKQVKARENLQKTETSIAVPRPRPQIAFRESANLDEAMDSADLDEAMDNLLAMFDEDGLWITRAEKNSWPIYIPETSIYFPGRLDSYRLTSEASPQRLVAQYSGQALAYFNKTNNTDYKFENGGEIIFGSEDHCYAVHCNFTAKPETAPLMPGDFSSKLFFAEHMPILHSKPSLTCCALLDGADYKNNCYMCPTGMICHPKTFQDGYKPPLD